MLPTLIQAPNLISLSIDTDEIAFDEINSFTNLQYLNVTYSTTPNHEQLNLFLSNLPVSLLSLNGMDDLQAQQIEIILQRCPLLTELDLNALADQDNYDKLNQILLNNQTLQTLHLICRDLHLFLPSLCSLLSLTNLNIGGTDIVDDDFHQLCSTLKNIKIIAFYRCTNIISSLKLLSSTLSYFSISYEYSAEQLIDLFSTCTYIDNIGILTTKLNIRNVLTYLFESSLRLTHIKICNQIDLYDILHILSTYSSLCYFSFRCSSMLQLEQPQSKHYQTYTYESQQAITQLKFKLQKQFLTYQHLLI
jgi:hypothetical protein